MSFFVGVGFKPTPTKVGQTFLSDYSYGTDRMSVPPEIKDETLSHLHPLAPGPGAPSALRICFCPRSWHISDYGQNPCE